MAWLSNVLQLVQVVAALGVVILVLLQHGKGADMGAAFGSGSSGSLFGATGSANFLSRMTGVAAAIFFITTLGLAYLGGQTPQQRGSVL
ncbi:MAG: preprotein translocase subunit SecG, partial [Burkholderiaceae bacterium]